jgi:uncharacterized protein (DUF2236 family)
VAHPLVAAGVADHSDYQHDLWPRLARTLRALYVITFGTKAEAERAGAAVQAVHAHVRGTTRSQLGSFPAGTPYSANDPELMLWVHATLVHASLSAYKRFEHVLSRAEQESYYRDMVTVAQLFGTPATVIPRTVADFRDYVAAQIGSRTVTVTPTAREIAQVILHAPLPTPMRMLGPAHRLVTAAQLPHGCGTNSTSAGRRDTRGCSRWPATRSSSPSGGYCAPHGTCGRHSLLPPDCRSTRGRALTVGASIEAVGWLDGCRARKL